MRTFFITNSLKHRENRGTANQDNKGKVLGKRRQAYQRIIAILLSFIIITGMAPAAAAMESPKPGETQLVISFEALPKETRWQSVENGTALDELNLPATLSASTEGGRTEVSVIWRADPVYDGNTKGLYIFTAALDEGWATFAMLPEIAVVVRAAQPRFSLFAFGGGAQATEPFQIGSAKQLAAITQFVNEGELETMFLGQTVSGQVYLKLEYDIDLSSMDPNGDDSGWVPIGRAEQGDFETYAFRGSFDGDGHKITGLKINREAADYQGLFGVIGEGGAVRNLGIQNGDIKGKDHLGTVAGTVYGSRIENCFSTGSITGSSFIGGIAGSVQGSVVRNCYHTGSVSGGVGVGGVAGQSSGRVQNCYSTGNVTGTGENIGGVVGAANGGTVQACAALNPVVSGLADVGRVAGGAGQASLQNNAAFGGMTVLVDSAKQDVSGTGAGHYHGLNRTAAEIKGESFFQTLFANEPSWTYETGSLPGFGAPIAMPAHIMDKEGREFLGEGTSEEPYEIHTAAELARLAELVNASNTDYNDKVYRLTSDLDLSGYRVNGGWVPIGRYLARFMGVFDGNGKTITGLFINRPEEDFQGLFGVLDDAMIKNIHIADAEITAKDVVGSVAGSVFRSSIQNCSSTGHVNGDVIVGGVVGHTFISTLQNCWSTCRVTGIGSSIGGVAGMVENLSEVQNCYSTGNVIGIQNVGGVTGTLDGSLQSCYSTGSVSGYNYVGGVTGSAEWGTVQNCAALNDEISADYTTGRIVGIVNYSSSLAGNIAFSGMKVNGSTVSGGTGSDQQGEDATADAIHYDTGSILSGRFTSDNGWTYTAGELPVLTGQSGQSSVLPQHIRYFGGGDGTSFEQAYEIHTPAQLAKLAELVNAGDNDFNSKHYKLMSNIDLSGYRENGGWMPIGNNSERFMGVFDGNGKTITGMYINRPEDDLQGLFGVLDDAIIKNIHIADAEITGRECAGGVVGLAEYGSIQNCSSTGHVNGENGVGGVVGAASYSTVQNCWSACSVTGIGGFIGGIAGAAGSSELQSCYSTGSVSGDLTIGGIVGVLYDVALENCAALNPVVSGSNVVGRVVGALSEGDIISNNYAFSEMACTSTGDSYDGQDFVPSQVLSAEFWANTLGFDESVWTIEDGRLPILKNLEEQSGAPDMHLIRFSTSPLTITPGGTGITGSNGAYAAFASYNRQEVSVTVTGWESWTETGVTIAACKTEAMDAIPVTPGGNGAGTFEIPAEFSGAISITATSVSNPGNKTEITLMVNKRDNGNSGDNGGDGGSSGSNGGNNSAGTQTDYQADVSNGGTLPISLNNHHGSISLDEQFGAALIPGGALAVAVPPIPGVESYSFDISMTCLTVPEGNGKITFKTTIGQIDVPTNMFWGIVEGGEKAEFTMANADRSELPEPLKAAIGERPILEISITVDGEIVAWNNPDAPVRVSIPYTPTGEERANPENIIIWYIDGNGNPICVPNGHYDPVTGTVTFTTTHFSRYAIAWNAVSFKDVAAHTWYSKAVAFIAARDITRGTGDGNYSPSAKLTRGEFIVLVMRAYGIAPDTNAADNFSDAGNTYYTGYLAAAKRLGISAGTGNNMYSPDKEITRQEMFTLLVNTLKTIHQVSTGDTGRKLSDFSDAELIEPWAEEAMALLVQTGTIKGNQGRLLPADKTTRAEMAQVLYSLLSK